MKFLRNIGLIFAINMGIMITISIVIELFGLRPAINARGIDYSALAAFCLIWGSGGALISLLLSKFIAKMVMRVEIISREVQDSRLRSLYSLVERLAARAGIKTPEVGIYRSPELNAFATGPSRDNALVAVSTGLLENMSESELEGVIGHEIAHVANGDMLTMTLLQGVVNSLVLFLAYIISFFVGNAVERRNRYWVEMMVRILCQIFLGFLGMIVLAWFSRYREFRADKGGAQFAGREKMIGALEALKQNFSQNTLQPSAAEAKFTAFKISSTKNLFNLLSSHPPLESRIEALKNFRG